MRSYAVFTLAEKSSADNATLKTLCGYPPEIGNTGHEITVNA